jgi:hypothetical protein
MCGPETCEDCVNRCVESQEVSPARHCLRHHLPGTVAPERQGRRRRAGRAVELPLPLFGALTQRKIFISAGDFHDRQLRTKLFGDRPWRRCPRREPLPHFGELAASQLSRITWISFPRARRARHIGTAAAIQCLDVPFRRGDFDSIPLWIAKNCPRTLHNENSLNCFTPALWIARDAVSTLLERASGLVSPAKGFPSAAMLYLFDPTRRRDTK